jgi:hypothetical protein
MTPTQMILAVIMCCPAAVTLAADVKDDKLVVTPPIIMPQELVKVQDRVLPPPTPVVLR